MVAVKKFTPKASPSDDPNKVRVSPKEVVGSLLIVRVNEFKEAVKTRFAPEGSPAIALDLVSVETGNVAPDQLWFNGALVDQLKDYVGEIVPCRLGWATSASSGYPYITVEETSDADDEAVAQFLDANPNVFDSAQGEAPAPASKAPAQTASAKPRW